MRHLRTGFTLIEILVVVLVVSILMAVVVAAFSGADQEQTLRGYVERLALRIEAARDKALQTNREWGVYLGEDGVSFAEFDELNGEWVLRAEKPFRADNYDASVSFEVEVEAFDALRSDGGDEDQPLPDLVLFSSGETTPFSILVTPVEWETLGWVLHSDGFSRTAVERHEA